MSSLPEKNTLIIPVGPSGAGKSKFFNDYINDEKHKGKYVIVSYDEVCEKVRKEFAKGKKKGGSL